MFPLHPEDRLRLEEDRARTLRESRPRRLPPRPQDPTVRPPRRVSPLGILMRR
jgi:hypothetical protein